MTDGKTKKIWSHLEEEQNMASTSCYACGATWKEMGERNHTKFCGMFSEAKSLALANCHMKMNTFSWLIKGKVKCI